MSDKNRVRKEREAKNHCAMGNHHFQAKNFLLAVNSYTKSLAKHAEAETFVRRASAYMEMKDLNSMQRAFDDLNEALKLEPANIKAVGMKAMLLSMHGFKVEAQNLLEQTTHSQKDADIIDKIKKQVNEMSYSKIPSFSYKNEHFKVHIMGPKAMDREKAKSAELRDNWKDNGPAYFIEKLPSKKMPEPTSMYLPTLDDLKEIVDKIDIDGGIIWHIALDNMTLTNELMEFFRSLKAKHMTGNTLTMLKVKCNKLEYFAELFSGKMLNPIAIWIDGIDNIKGFEMHKAVSEFSALKNAAHLKMNMAISNEIFQKSILQPAYFPDINALFEFVERPVDKEMVRPDFSMDILPPQSRVLFEHVKRQLDIDAVRMGMDLLKFKQICIQRFCDSRTPSAAYRIEISTKINPLEVMSSEEKGRGGDIYLNMHTDEVMVLNVYGSEKFAANGQPKLWVLFVERMPSDSVPKDLTGADFFGHAANGFHVMMSHY